MRLRASRCFRQSIANAGIAGNNPSVINPEQLDSQTLIVTPENIAFKYRVAGPFRRAPALLIDWLVLLAIMFGSALLVAALWRISFLGTLALRNLLWFVLFWFYGGLLETFWNGQTIGKKAMGIRVVTVDGQPISGLQAIARNVLRVVDGLPLVPLVVLFPMEGAGFLEALFPNTTAVMLFQVGLLAPAFNRRFQRLGDLACGTMVVIDERQESYGVIRVTEPAAIQLSDAIPHYFVASRTLIRALSVYVARRPRFSAGRRAAIAEPLGRALAMQLQLPAGVNYDLLLCAIYHRALIADGARDFDRKLAPGPQPRQPQAQPATVESFLDQLA